MLLKTLMALAIPLLAFADPSVLKYQLANNSRAEIHLDSSQDGPTVQILLFHPNLSEPLAVSPQDPTDVFGHSMIIQNGRNYIFPLPDNSHSLLLPEWAKIDASEVTRNSLKDRGILILGDRTKNGEFVHVFPLLHDLKTGRALSVYRVRDEARLENLPQRHYSAAIVDTDDMKENIEANMLLSVLDTNEKGEARALGTVAVASNGLNQMQNTEWSDFSKLGVSYRFQQSSARANGADILIDGKVWGRPVIYRDYRSWNTRWPGANAKVQRISPTPEQAAAIAKQWVSLNKQGFHKPVLSKGSQFRLGLSGDYQKAIHQIEQDTKELQIRQSEMIGEQLDSTEKFTEFEMEFADRMMKNSGITDDVAKAKLTALGYSHKQLLSHNDNTQYIAISILAAKGRHELKTLTWVVHMELGTDRILEKYKLPAGTGIDDVWVLPSGQAFLKNGQILDVNSKPKANSCRQIYAK